MWRAGIAGLLIVTLFTREALSPIRSLTGAARRLGGGDLSYRVPSNRKDEVGELARTFNEMATALERAEANRRTITADIAHELRTPLTNIRGYIEAIRDGVSGSLTLPRSKHCTNRQSTCLDSWKTFEFCQSLRPPPCASIYNQKTFQPLPGTR